MTRDKGNLRMDRKMVSPRASVALSALDAVRTAVSFLRKCFATRPAATSEHCFGKNDQFREPSALTRYKEITAAPIEKEASPIDEITRSRG
jgi:hypothetical protein